VSIKKLVYRFHNPNSEDETRRYITQVFLEASRVKFENILRETANRPSACIYIKESSENVEEWLLNEVEL